MVSDRACNSTELFLVQFVSQGCGRSPFPCSLSKYKWKAEIVWEKCKMYQLNIVRSRSIWVRTTTVDKMKQLHLLLTSCVSFLVSLSSSKNTQHLISGRLYWHVALLRVRVEGSWGCDVLWYQICAMAVGATQRLRAGVERWCCCRHPFSPVIRVSLWLFSSAPWVQFISLHERSPVQPDS